MFLLRAPGENKPLPQQEQLHNSGILGTIGSR